MVDFFDLSWVEVINSNISIFIRSSQSSEWNETKTFLHLTPKLSGSDIVYAVGMAAAQPF